MCDICGCSHDHHHDHDHDDQSHGRVLKVERDVLSVNNRIAESNRTFFNEHGIFALNLVSSPGSGKTTLLEQTIKTMGNRADLAVVEGDQQTSRDAERISATGIPAVQVNTGAGCHLDAHMVKHALEELKPAKRSILFIENVGNLVCPALFDLGEDLKVVVISVTEGDDKPLKYPGMFHAANVCVINKTDLLGYVNFDVETCKKFALQANPQLTFFELSALKGDGMESWIEWLLSRVKRTA